MDHTVGTLSAGRKLGALVTAAAFIFAFALITGGVGLGAQGDLKRVSVSTTGDEADADSAAMSGAISADGSRVVFYSDASNLVADDTNGEPDAFLWHRDTGVTERVSVSSTGEQGNDNSGGFEASLPRISADGKSVVFVSAATNLVPGDTNAALDVFVRSLASGLTTRVSVSSNGSEANSSSLGADISGDGRYVTFGSGADNLVSDDTNNTTDIFVHDRQSGETTRVSTDSNGVEGNGESTISSISADGRHIAFMSDADNLVPGDTNGTPDIFVHDRDTAITSRVSIRGNGTEANGFSAIPVLSSNGRFVAFASEATNLVPGDTNGVMDVFVHDRLNGTTSRVSVNGAVQGDAESVHVDISGNGRFVTFGSAATNLVPNDDNGALDVFVHDRQTSQTRRVSVAQGGATEGDGDSNFPAFSETGRHVVFTSEATNLVSGDGNGLRDVFVYQLLPDPPPTTTTTTTATTTSTTTPGGQTPPPGGGDYFVDDDGSIFESAIDWMYEKGITLGCNPPVNDRFCPEEDVTRGQMAAFLVRALGLTDDGGGDLFVDDDGSTFEGDIDRLGTARVTLGCNPPVNDRFCPEEDVTRGQMAAFLVRALGLTDDGGGDLFVDDDGSTFEGDIDRLGTARVTLGCNPPANDRFCPNDQVTRGQMAAFLQRAAALR